MEEAPNNTRIGMRISNAYTETSHQINTENNISSSSSINSNIHPAPSSSSMEYQLKKYLLLLATLVATVTYAAGLNPPGGSWPEDDASRRQLAGESILRDTNYMRYIVFYWFNAISFAASLVVSLLLLLLDREGKLLKLTRAVMVVDLLGLMGAYAAGTSHDKFTTISSTVLIAATATYVILIVPRLSATRGESTAATSADELDKHEILLVLAIFVTTIAYVAGLNPPGGFWRSSNGGDHAAGEPVLEGFHPIRYKFFFSNTIAFIASLLAITITVHYEKLDLTSIKKVPLYGLIIASILGLGGAYATGSCRDSRHTTYVLALVVPVLACIFLQSVLKGRGGIHYDDLDKTREFIQLLATLAATVAYQAGVDPPGGVWADNGDGHSVGDPILLTTDPGRYNVFFYFNSASFVASLVIMVMLQNEYLVRRHALDATMILDLFGLIGAYAAGSCRDTSTSIYTIAMAGGVLIYVVIHIVFSTLDPTRNEDKKRDGNRLKEGEQGNNRDEEKLEKMQGKEDKKQKLEKKREVLLLLAILAATLTYQAGLTPPGGFWEKDELGHQAGFPVLLEKYPHRYKAFFYCNAASFMASVALIVLLLNPNLYGPGIKCYALFVCMVAGMFSLIGAYAAGSSLHLRTSIIVLILVIAVFAVVLYMAIIRHHLDGKKDDKPQPTNDIARIGQQAEHQQDNKEADMMAKYLMLVGILAASVAYLTGLKPPGGLWRNDDSNGHSAGNPVLYDIDKRRYNAFFYSNSTSFMASITVITLLLRRMLGDKESDKNKMPLWPMHTAMLLDLLALLGAYAAGSARNWCTSKDVILLLLPILGFIALLFFWKKGGEANPNGTQQNTPA
uniref:PGG domain-containing protein n=1 Tax=Leersia perrieri TaxID=77586 RepID=A0A0D9XVC0_9ORYZ